MDIVFVNAAGVFLFLATLHYLLFLAFQSRVVSKVARVTLVLAVLCQVGFFASRFILGAVPLATNFFESLVFFSFVLALTFLVFSFLYPFPVVGAFVLPVAFIFQLAALLSGDRGLVSLPPALKSWWLPFHVAFSFMGDALFAVAFAAGVMYLLQEGNLKARRVGAFYHRLPSLEVLDAINYRSLTYGFPLLTLGIITGSIWAQTAWGSYWSWDPKETWSLITWLIFAALLHARLTVGWRGRKAAWMAIVGFAAALFTFLGVGLLLPGQHSYL